MTAAHSNLAHALVMAYEPYRRGEVAMDQNQNHVDIAVLKTDLAYIKEAISDIKDGVGEIKTNCREEHQCVNDLNTRITDLETTRIASLSARILSIETERGVYNKWSMYIAGIAGGTVGAIVTAVILYVLPI